jgi:chemotaxis protein CheD
MKKISVGIAEMQIAHAPDSLISYGFGSCIGIAIFDPYAKIGGLAHAMLCANTRNTPPGNPLKYVDSAVDAVLSALLEAGCSRGTLLAKMAGGAHMFGSASTEAGLNIGERNSQAARRRLDELGIPLVAEDVGGTYGRTIELDLNDGILTVRSIRTGSKQI